MGWLQKIFAGGGGPKEETSIQKTPSVQALIEQLKDPGCAPSVVEDLASTHDKRAVPALIDALKVENLRRAAARNLGEFGERRAVKPLIRSLEGEAPRDLKFCRSVAVSLQRLSPPSPVRPLIRQLESDDVDVRCAAARRLTSMPLGEPGDESFTKVFGSGDAGAMHDRFERKSRAFYRHRVIRELARANSMTVDQVRSRASTLEAAKKAGLCIEGIDRNLRLEDEVIRELASINGMSPSEVVAQIGTTGFDSAHGLEQMLKAARRQGLSTEGIYMSMTGRRR